MPALWQTAAELHLPVFPCLPDKRPSIPKTKGGHGFKDATTDPRKIRDMFLAYPASRLIGVATGEYSGFDILDLDTKKHPDEVRSWLVNYKRLIPPTRAHRTESGGVHYVFEHLAGLGSWNGRPVLGVDGRCDGGYAIWWPAAGLPINGKDIRPWPSDLVRQFLKAPPPPRSNKPPPPSVSEPRLERIVRKIGLAQNGERNSLLFWGSCRVGEWINAGELPREVGESALLCAARHAGLPDTESVPTINSGLSRT